MPTVDRLTAAARYRLSPRFLYVDLHRHADQTILVVGSRRSGTTWVSELINYHNDFRTIFEPFHPLHSSWSGATNSQWAKYVEPDHDDQELAARCARLWAGRLRDHWTDKHNTKRVATRRVIKSVESTNLLPWIAARWPALKLVYVIRHPFATSESQMEVSFQDGGLTDLNVLRTRQRLIDGVCATLSRSKSARELVRSACAPFEQHVVRWCLENRIPLSMLTSQHLHVVSYEDLVVHTRSELIRLGWFLGQPFDDLALEAAKKPSSTDFRSRVERAQKMEPVKFLSEWQRRISPEDADRGLRVLDAFDLNHLYDRGPLPLVDGAKVLDATRLISNAGS